MKASRYKLLQRTAGVLLVGLLGLQCQAFTPARAEEPPSLALTPVISRTETQGKKAASLTGLLEVDGLPLARRTPLILIHGINPDPKVGYGWKGFIDYIRSQPRAKANFHDQYKMYLYVYRPNVPLAENGKRIRATLRDFWQSERPGKPMRIAALSLGGLLAREAMQDEVVRTHTDRIIGIGAPFHGTPLANPAWVRSTLKQQIFSPLRVSNRVIYWFVKRRFPNFREDLCWDNFDGLMPPELTAKEAPCPQQPYTAEEKFIVYAGFFHADPVAKEWLKKSLDPRLAKIALMPEKYGRIGRHGMFKFVQSYIARLPLVDEPSLAPGEFYPMTWFNDGISPISSQLWLGRLTQEISARPIPVRAQWHFVQSLYGSQRARLFEALDHRDWLEGNTRIRGADRLTDLFHPDLSRHNIFEWLEYDLTRPINHAIAQDDANGA